MGLFGKRTSMNSSGNGNIQVVSSGHGGSSKVTVNGRTLYVEGSNISIVNGQVFVDGKLIEEGDAKVSPGTFSSITKIVVEGNAKNVEGGCDIEVKGDVYGDVSAGMNATVGGNVKGGVDAGMNATVHGCVDGDVDAGMNATVHNR